MYYSSRAIILKNRDLRESDKLVTIFSEKEGKLTAVAKGVKKSKSSLRACVQPFCQSQLYLSHGKELDLITQGKLINFYANSREDINRTLYCMYIMELLDKSLMDRAALPELFRTAIAVLELINEYGLNPLFIRYFEMKLLVNLGYSPVVDNCSACGSRNIQNFAFSLSEGGLLCDDCIARGEVELIKLSGETIGLIRLLSQGNTKTLKRVKASPGALRQLEFFLEKYLEYYLDRRFNMKNTIKLLKKTIAAIN